MDGATLGLIEATKQRARLDLVRLFLQQQKVNALITQAILQIAEGGQPDLAKMQELADVITELDKQITEWISDLEKRVGT